MIDEVETFRLFGYHSTDLKPKSHKKIIAVCDNPECNGNRVRIIQKSNYTHLCKACAANKRWEDPLEREKTGKASKEYWDNNPEAVERERERNLKRYEDPEEHEKTRDAVNKYWEDPLAHEKAREAQLKRFEDPLECEKASETANKRWEDPLEREKASETGIKRYEDPLEHEKTGISVKEFYINNPKAREKARDAALQYIIDNPEQARINKRNGGLASCESQDGKSSSIELKMRKILTDNNYQFITNTPLLNMCIPDIVFKTEKVIIQCDGDYWHDYPNGLDKDYTQDKILKANGWQVIRFWEHEINNDIKGCLEKFEWETFRRFNT